MIAMDEILKGVKLIAPTGVQAQNGAGTEFDSLLILAGSQANPGEGLVVEDGVLAIQETVK
jgi:hypothetical protein